VAGSCPIVQVERAPRSIITAACACGRRRLPGEAGTCGKRMRFPRARCIRQGIAIEQGIDWTGDHRHVQRI